MSIPININHIRECANIKCQNKPYQGGFTIVTLGGSDHPLNDPGPSFILCLCVPCANALEKITR